MSDPLPTPYSHRDRRAHRDLGRLTGEYLAILAAAIPAAVAVPWPLVGAALVLGVAVATGVFVVRLESLLRAYREDLEQVAAGSAGSPWLRVEVGSRVGLERGIVRPTARSPNSRSPARGTPGFADSAG